MNPIGVYYAYWESAWAADYLPYVEKARRLGFDALELAAGALPDMTKERRLTLAKAACDAGIELTYCIGLPKRYDLADPDKEIRARGAAYARTLLDCIAEMGGRVLGGIIYSSWPNVPSEGITDKSDWWGRSVESVKTLAKTAEDLGILYCLEVVNRFEQFLINTAEEGVRFADDVGSPAVKLLLDTFHMNIEEDSIGGAIRSAAGYIGHFHIGETNRKTPGAGRMPWREITDALADIRYAGRVVMEPFVRMGGEVGRDIKVWRDLARLPSRADEAETRLDEDARDACAFIRSMIAASEASGAAKARAYSRIDSKGADGL